MNIAVWREKIVHDNKMDLPSVGNLYPMQPVKLREKGIGVVLDMIVIISKNPAQELMLCVMYGLDDILVIPREIEKTSTLSRRAKLGEDVLAGERHEVVGWIDFEDGAQMPEHPRGVVLKFEIVFG